MFFCFLYTLFFFNFFILFPKIYVCDSKKWLQWLHRVSTPFFWLQGGYKSGYTKTKKRLKSDSNAVS